MKVFHVSWNVPETGFHEMLWKKNFKVYPCLKEDRWRGRKCVQGLWMDPKNSGTFIFLECSSVLTAAVVTNAFLSYTLLIWWCFRKTTNLPLECINRIVGVLANNPPAIQFSCKFEFILCKNCTKTSKLSTFSRRLSSLNLFSLEQFSIKRFIVLY